MERWFFFAVLSFWVFSFNSSVGADIDTQVTKTLTRQKSVSIMIQCGHPSVFKKELDLMSETLDQINIVSTSSKVRTDVNNKELAQLINLHQNLALDIVGKVLGLLDFFGLKYKIFWVTLIIYVPKANSRLINSIAGVEGVINIRLPKITPVPKPQLTPAKPAPKPVDNVPWNIALINGRCPDIQKLGEGVLVGSVDVSHIS